jgi:hypothetical protein
VGKQQITIKHVRAKDLVWRYRGSGLGATWPVFRDYHVIVDPFPAYPHDEKVVRVTLQECTDAWDPGTPVTVFISHYEEESRSLAHMHMATGYREDDGEDDHPVPTRYPTDAAIWMSGKRTPMHPAQTRYIVAHEYGHAVADWIANLRKQEERDFDDEYRKMRGLRHLDAEGGRWHLASQEVFACDFRVLVADVESEFWPHDPVPRPNRAGVMTWWRDAKKEWKARG